MYADVIYLNLNGNPRDGCRFVTQSLQSPLPWQKLRPSCNHEGAEGLGRSWSGLGFVCTYVLGLLGPSFH